MVKKSEHVTRLNSSEWKIRMEAVYYLAEDRESSSFDLLIKAAKDPVWQVRQAAVVSLGEWFDTEKKQSSVEKVEAHGAVVTTGFIEDIKIIKDTFKEGERANQARQASQTLVKALKDEPYVRMAAADALGKLGDPSTVASLIDVLLKDKLYYVSKAAAQALGVVRDSMAVDPLIFSLKHAEWEVRRAAATALGKIGNSRAIDSLEKALDDDISSVREAAAEALFRILYDENFPSVKKYLDDISPKSSYGKKREMLMKAARLYSERMQTMKLDSRMVTEKVGVPKRLRGDKETLPPIPAVKPVNRPARFSK